MAFALRRNFGGKYYAFEYMSTEKGKANKYAERRRSQGKRARVVKGKAIGKLQYGVYTQD